MVFNRTVLLLLISALLPHVTHAAAATPAQHLTHLEQKLTQQVTSAKLPVNVSSMIKQLKEPLTFFFELSQQHPIIVPAFDSFLSRLISLTYTRGEAKHLSHQREITLTTFVGVLANTLPAHTTNPAVRREAYQQVRVIYNYYANRALTRSVQLGNASPRVVSREEKVLRWVKTGAIIAAVATAAALAGTAIYQISQTPVPSAPLAPSRPNSPAASPSETPVPTTGTPASTGGLGSADLAAALDGGTVDDAPEAPATGALAVPSPAPAPASAPAVVPVHSVAPAPPNEAPHSAASTPNTHSPISDDDGKRRLDFNNLSPDARALPAAPVRLADSASSRRTSLPSPAAAPAPSDGAVNPDGALPVLATASPLSAASPALSSSPPAKIAGEWETAFESMNGYDISTLLEQQYKPITPEDAALPIVVKLNPTELAPYFTKISGGKNMKKNLLRAAIHTTLVRDRNIAERKSLAAHMAATRGNADRLVVLIPTGTKFFETLNLTAKDVTAVGKEFWTTAAGNNLQTQLTTDWTFVDKQIRKLGMEEQAQFRSLFRPQHLPT